MSVRELSAPDEGSPLLGGQKKRPTTPLFCEIVPGESMPAPSHTHTHTHTPPIHTHTCLGRAFGGCMRVCRRPGFSPGLEDPLEEGMATHSSILAWRIPCTKEPGGVIKSLT